jgi:hypothetical protein
MTEFRVDHYVPDEDGFDHTPLDSLCGPQMEVRVYHHSFAYSHEDMPSHTVFTWEMPEVPEDASEA